MFLNRLFRFLMDDEILAKNPMAKIRPPKVEQKVVDPISPAEIQKCFKAARADRGYIGVRDSVIFATLVSTGLRREELCSLSDADVRIDDGALLVHGKGRKQRLVPIPESLKKMLAHYKFARNDVKAGADILTLQAICGWSQLGMAQRYAKPSMAKMQRSMDSFSPASGLK